MTGCIGLHRSEISKTLDDLDRPRSPCRASSIAAKRVADLCDPRLCLMVFVNTTDCFRKAKSVFAAHVTKSLMLSEKIWTLFKKLLL